METAIVYYLCTGLIVATFYRSSTWFKAKPKVTPSHNIEKPEIKEKIYSVLKAQGFDNDEIEYAINFYRKEGDKLINEAQKRIESEVQEFSPLKEIAYIITMTTAWPVLIYAHLKLFININRG
jgi:hypothetical protein